MLITIVAFATVTAAVLQLVGEYLFTRETQIDTSYLREITPDLNEMYESGDMQQLYRLSLRYADRHEGRILLTDPEGRIVIDTKSEQNGSRLDISGIKEITGSIEKESLFTRSYGDENVFCICKGPYSGGYIVAVFNAGRVFESIYGICMNLGVIVLAVLCVMLIVNILLTRTFTQPVHALSAAIGKLSDGDFTVRVSEIGNNEFTDLSRAFNEMAGRMETLDRSRNQFVSNASHELKTPMAGIKALVQTLQYQEPFDPAMTAEFLGDIDKEIDRLTAVVGDLLTLVGMDSGETKLKIERFSLNELLQDDVKRLSPLARNRGIEMEIELKDDIDIYGDRLKLDQVFYNLIDNALKYTPRGAGVRIEATKSNKNAVVHVKDQGIGIPEEDIKHIFDRFYRVDKARSRDTGGTGLGLSIVKQIILDHGGNITVSSKVNVGSDFRVQLPLGNRTGTGKNA